MKTRIVVEHKDEEWMPFSHFCNKTLLKFKHNRFIYLKTGDKNLVSMNDGSVNDDFLSTEPAWKRFTGTIEVSN